MLSSIIDLPFTPKNNQLEIKDNAVPLSEERVFAILRRGMMP